MAGEIQLNSTTMATESSGSITAELDTIRPNTTNGSLTLQGDSSDAGVTGLTIDSSGNATFAGTISGGTIGSSVVFPSNHLIGFGYGEETSTTGDINTLSGGFQSSGLQGIIFGTEINVGSVLNGQKVIFSLMGGQAYFNSTTDGNAPYYSTSCGIAYNTDNTTPTTSSTRVILWSSAYVSELATGSNSVSPCGSYVILNSSGSTQTIKIKFWLGSNENGFSVNTKAHWDGSRTYNPIRYQYYILSA